MKGSPSLDVVVGLTDSTVTPTVFSTRHQWKLGCLQETLCPLQRNSAHFPLFSWFWEHDHPYHPYVLTNHESPGFQSEFLRNLGVLPDWFQACRCWPLNLCWWMHFRRWGSPPRKSETQRLPQDSAKIVGVYTISYPAKWTKSVTQPLRGGSGEKPLQLNLAGGFKYFLFSPQKLGKMNPFWRAYFSDGLKPPTSNLLASSGLQRSESAKNGGRKHRIPSGLGSQDHLGCGVRSSSRGQLTFREVLEKVKGLPSRELTWRKPLKVIQLKRWERKTQQEDDFPVGETW